MSTVEKADPRKNLNVRINKAEKEAIKAKADQFANGDVSKWVRDAALNYVPRKQEING